MRTEYVVVLPHDAQWTAEFEKIKAEIMTAIGNLVIDIEHIGSTAVPGLSAKPCIDLDVVIQDMRVFDAIAQGLEAIDYIHEGNLGIEGREAFRYTDKPHLLMHHLYVCPQNSAELHRHLVFRDFLCSHPEAVRQYSAVKEEAARLYPNDIERYIAYKSPCIEALYRQCGLI